VKKIFFIFWVLLIFSCEKEYPAVKGNDIQGVYKFHRVTLSSFDNGTSQTQTTFMNGMTYTNPWDVFGLDVITTDASLVKIQRDSIYFNATISPTDTLWYVSYPLEGNVLNAKDPELISFYPMGLKRTWKVSGPISNSLIISAPIHWPQGSAGSAWSITYLIEKL
jgi:hypothetical protein